MSFIDDKLLNSNFLNEPLNHLMYIQSLENNGENSYLFDTHAEDQLKDLLLNSKSVWAHSEFYDMFMEKLTDDQIKMLFKEHKNIGDILNSLFGNGVYSTGSFDDVCEYMTETGIHKMPVRFLKIFKSIITEIVESDNALNWINERYGIDLSSYKTLDVAVKNTEAWKLMLANTSLMSVLCITDYFTEKVIESDFKQIWVTTDGLTYYTNDGVQYNKSTNEPTGSTVASETLELMKTSKLVSEDKLEVRDSAYKRLREAITWFLQNESLPLISDHDDLVDILITSEDCCQYLADNATTTLKAALENYRFAKKIFTSDLLFEKIGSNQEALKVIVDFIADIQKSYDTLAKIKPNLLAVSENTGDIYDATALMKQIKPIVDDINAVMTDITDCQDYTKITKENIDGLMKNTSAILNMFSNLTFVKMVCENADFAKQIVNNEDVATYISEHSDSYNVLLSGDAFLDALINDEGSLYESHWISTEDKRKLVVKNETAMKKIGTNEDLTRRFLNKQLNYEDSSFSDYATNMATTVYIGSVTNDETAMDFIANDKMCADTIVDSKAFMDSIYLSPYFDSVETDTFYNAMSEHGDIGFIKYIQKKTDNANKIETFTNYVKSIKIELSTGDNPTTKMLMDFISQSPDLSYKLITNNAYLLDIYFDPSNLGYNSNTYIGGSTDQIYDKYTWSWMRLFDPLKDKLVNNEDFIGHLLYFITNPIGYKRYIYGYTSGGSSYGVTYVAYSKSELGEVSISSKSLSDMQNSDYDKLEKLFDKIVRFAGVSGYTDRYVGTYGESFYVVKDYLYMCDMFMTRRLIYLVKNKNDLSMFDSLKSLCNDKDFMLQIINNTNCFGIALSSPIFVDEIKNNKEIFDLFYKNYSQVQTVMKTTVNYDKRLLRDYLIKYLKTSDLYIHKTWHVDDDNESLNKFTSSDYETIDDRRCLVISITNNGNGNYYGLTIEGSGENVITNGTSEVPIMMFVKTLKIKAPGSIKAIDYIPID